MNLIVCGDSWSNGAELAVFLDSQCTLNLV
jgi:hypothetical protein